MKEVITRFAPSPTGHLHIGGARTALFCWLLARHFKGKFTLRIEDTDLERSKQEYTDGILASMKWLGLDWDGEPVYQTQRTALYSAAIDVLLKNGHAYWCSCSPEEVEAMRELAREKGEKAKYNTACREKNLGPGEGRVVRLKAPLQGIVSFSDIVKGPLSCDVAELDDMVLLRSDGMATYNMAVVVDDHDMRISHVMRGDDHVSNTFKQVLLYQAFGWDLPIFGHVPMILGPDKKKLSKRHGARSVVEYQTDGLLPEALLNCLVRLGWSHGDQDLFSVEELIEYFDGTSLSASSSVFDMTKLQWLNGQIMRNKPLDELALLVRSFLPQNLQTCDEEKLKASLPLYLERAQTLPELAAGVSVLLCEVSELVYDEKAVEKAFSAEGRAHIAKLCEALEGLEAFDRALIEACIKDYVAQNDIKFKEIGPPLRVALTGSLGGPHLHEMMEVMGKEESLVRLRAAL